MPHKYNADRRHHIPRPKRRVTNWAEYNEALRQRGSLTVWFGTAARLGERAEQDMTGRVFSWLGIRMGWVLRLVETGVDGSSRSVDVMAIDRPGDLGDIADLGLTLAQGKRLVALVQQEIVTAQNLFVCARRSWRDPAGGSPVRVRGSARPVASVAGSSATMVAKRTQRDDEDCIEPRKTLTVEAEALQTAAGNMCGTVMRGTVAPPGSETSSSRQGSCRNLGDLLPPAVATAIPGRFGKARSRSRTGR